MEHGSNRFKKKVDTSNDASTKISNKDAADMINVSVEGVTREELL